MSVAVGASSYAAGAVTVDRSNYWRYYGLKRDPFVPGTRESEFYLSPRWEQALDLLRYLCQEANVLLTVTADKGAGKTTFLGQFIDQFGDNLQVCRLAASANLDVPGLLASITRDFALPAIPTELSQEEQLDAQLSQLQYNPQLCLLTIDNAQRLTDETLQALLYLVAQQSESQKRLHVLLVGEPELKERLSQLAEQNNEKEVCHHIALEPLDLAETKGYLTQRMTAVGLPAGLPFSTRDITRLHNQTGGVPSRINAVARQMLLDAITQRRFKFITSFLSTRKTLLLGALTTLTVLLLCAIFLERGNNRPPLAFIKTATASDAIGQPINVPLVPTPVKPILVNPDQTIVIDQSSVSVEKTLQQNNVQATHANVLASNTEQVVGAGSKPALSGTTKRAGLGPAPTPAVASPHLLHGNYTIQLMGVSNKQKLKTFITAHKIQHEVKIIHTQHQGHDWYVLLYGAYPTEKAAIQAIKELPADLHALNPWVKKISK